MNLTKIIHIFTVSQGNCLCKRAFKVDRIENVKIGIFDPYLDDLGGGEKYMLNVAECLSKEHEVSLFWDKREDIEEASERFPIDLSKIHLRENIFSPNTSFLKRFLASRNFDAIIVLSDGSIPLLLTKNLFIHIQSPIHNLNVGWWDRIKLRRVKKVFCNSYFTKHYVDKTYRINSDVLYPPILFDSKKIKKENIILHVGRFRVRNVKVGDYKKQSVMIDAFEKMSKKDFSGWRLVIASGVKNNDIEGFEEMKRGAKDFPIEFIVNASNKELLDFYNKSKIYWHASGFGEDLEKHPEYAEHFGISTVEAMAAGSVPVVINAGGQREIVEDGKSGFLWNTLDDLTMFTTRLINNEKLLTKMSEAAIKRSRIFAGERFCRELQNIIF